MEATVFSSAQDDPRLRTQYDKSLTWETETTQLKRDIQCLKWETQTNNETTLEWEKTELPRLFSSGEKENSDNSLKWETTEHETKYTVRVPETDQGWIGEVRHDQRRLGELTAVSPSTMDAKMRKQHVFIGKETKRHEEDSLSQAASSKLVSASMRH